MYVCVSVWVSGVVVCPIVGAIYLNMATKINEHQDNGRHHKWMVTEIGHVSIDYANDWCGYNLDLLWIMMM